MHLFYFGKVTTKSNIGMQGNFGTTVFFNPVTQMVVDCNYTEEVKDEDGEVNYLPRVVWYRLAENQAFFWNRKVKPCSKTILFKLIEKGVISSKVDEEKIANEIQRGEAKNSNSKGQQSTKAGH